MAANPRLPAAVSPPLVSNQLQLAGAEYRRESQRSARSRLLEKIRMKSKRTRCLANKVRVQESSEAGDEKIRYNATHTYLVSGYSM